MNKIKLVAAIFIGSALMQGCIRVNTNPYPAFEEIREQICEKTGASISWNRCEDESNLQCIVNELLQQELTVDSAVYIALLNNRHLQAAYEKLGIAKADLVQAGLLPNPIFSLAYRFTIDSNISDLIDMSILHNFLETLLIPLKKRVAATEYEITKEKIMTQVLEVIAETKTAFFELQALQEIFGLQQELLLAADAASDAARRLYSAGNILELDMADQLRMYEEAKVEIADMEIEVLEARERLNVLMGLWGNQINWCADACLPSITDCEQNWYDVENLSVINSIDLHIKRREICAAAGIGDIETARVVFPELAIGPDSERDEGVWFLGPAISLAIPFFDFGQARQAAWRAEIMRLWNEYTALAIEIRSSARRARFQMLNAYRKNLFQENEIIPLSEKITNLTHLLNNAMQIGVFGLLEAKQEEIVRKIQCIEFQKDYWVMRTKLELILSGHMPEMKERM